MESNLAGKHRSQDHRAEKGDFRCRSRHVKTTKLFHHFSSSMTNIAWASVYEEKLKKASAKCKGCHCVIWEGTIERGKRVNYGQIYAKIRKADSGCYEYHTVKVHRLRHMVKLKDSRQIKEKDMHVSHLCFSHLCIEPSHLSYEPADINVARETCKGDLHCYGHSGYDDCIFCQCDIK